MRTKIILVSGWAAAIGLAVAGWLIFKPSALKDTARADTARTIAPKPTPRPTTPAVTLTLAPNPSPAEPAGDSPARAPRSQTASSDTATKVALPSAPAKKPKARLQDPDARAALRLVGADPDAEQYWIAAINDSSLPGSRTQGLDRRFERGRLVRSEESQRRGIAADREPAAVDRGTRA